MSFSINKTGNSFRLSNGRIEVRSLAKLSSIPSQQRTAFTQQKPLQQIKKAKETINSYILITQTAREPSGDTYKKSVDACFVHVYVVLLANGQTIRRVVKKVSAPRVKPDQFYIDLVTPHLLPLVTDQPQHYRITMRLWRRRYKNTSPLAAGLPGDHVNVVNNFTVVTSDLGWYKIEREPQSPQ